MLKAKLHQMIREMDQEGRKPTRCATDVVLLAKLHGSDLECVDIEVTSNRKKEELVVSDFQNVENIYDLL